MNNPANNLPSALALPATVGKLDDFVLGVDVEGVGYALLTNKKERQAALQAIAESNDVAGSLEPDDTFIPYERIMAVETWEHLPTLRLSWTEPGRKSPRKVPFTLASIDQSRAVFGRIGVAACDHLDLIAGKASAFMMTQ